MTTSAPGVSVILSNYNGWALLEQALPTVVHQTYTPLEIMVVDDASTDESAEKITQHYPQIKLIVLPENKGYAGANNAAVAKAQYDWILLLNNDIQLPPSTVTVLIRKALENPDIAVLGPAIKNLNMDMDRYPRNGTMSLTGAMIQNVFRDPTLAFGISGCAVLFDRSRLGLPFDADYQFFHEDVFLSWKARLMGLGVQRVPEVTVLHLGEATLKTRGERNRYFMERNRRLNRLTFYSLPTGANCAIAAAHGWGGSMDGPAEASLPGTDSASPILAHGHRELIRQKAGRSASLAKST